MGKGLNSETRPAQASQTRDGRPARTHGRRPSGGLTERAEHKPGCCGPRAAVRCCAQTSRSGWRAGTARARGKVAWGHASAGAAARRIPGCSPCAVRGPPAGRVRHAREAAALGHHRPGRRAPSCLASLSYLHVLLRAPSKPCPDVLLHRTVGAAGGERPHHHHPSLGVLPPPPGPGPPTPLPACTGFLQTPTCMARVPLSFKSLCRCRLPRPPPQTPPLTPPCVLSSSHQLTYYVFSSFISLLPALPSPAGRKAL